MIGFLQMEKKCGEVTVVQAVESWAARWGCDYRGRERDIGRQQIK